MCSRRWVLIWVALKWSINRHMFVNLARKGPGMSLRGDLRYATTWLTTRTPSAMPAMRVNVYTLSMARYCRRCAKTIQEAETVTTKVHIMRGGTGIFFIISGREDHMQVLHGSQPCCPGAVREAHQSYQRRVTSECGSTVVDLDLHPLSRISLVWSDSQGCRLVSTVEYGDTRGHSKSFVTNQPVNCIRS